MANERRLIDANALWEEIDRIYSKHFAKSREPFVIDTFKAMFKRIKNAPTVDAVEVIRCKDCKRSGTDDCIFHIKGEPADEELLQKLDNDFCSYGERKDNVQEE